MLLLVNLNGRAPMQRSAWVVTPQEKRLHQASPSPELTLPFSMAFKASSRRATISFCAWAHFEDVLTH